MSTAKKYNGLKNDGATCYLNSLIQTLFMTYQFRSNLYSYHHDPKKIKDTDSIPFQLQKLFVHMQEKSGACQTRGLQKSFQWEQQDAWQQHDVQQFCRKLFEAIQIAFKQPAWLRDLYTGVITSYINCGKHYRKKQEIYMDLSLPIRDCKTLEQCIKQYLKPQQIQGVQCQQCGQKTTVKKGMKFSSYPTILTIQLNRFELNYQTWQRQKLNSFLYFPEVINMGKFLVDYDKIQISPLPQGLQKNVKIAQKEKSARFTDFGFDNSKFKQKRKNSFDKEVSKQKVKFFDEENRNMRENQVKPKNKQQIKQESKDFLLALKLQKETLDAKMNKIQEKQIKDIEQDMLFGTIMSLGPGAWKSPGSFQKPKERDPIQQIYSQTQAKFQHQEQSFDPDKQYDQHTYALNAVLVHAGGAYGGHYFAYIFDGLDWYRFDDETVVKVSKNEIRKYGNYNISNTMHGANAYLLFYRDVRTFKDINSLSAPQQLKQLAKLDEVIQEKYQNKKQARTQQIANSLLVQIYRNNKEFQKIIIDNRFTETLADLRQKIKVASNIGEQQANWRIRRYNPQQDLMYEVYGTDFNTFSLDSLGFREKVYLVIQTKAPQEVFQDYDPKKMLVKLNVWRQNIQSLTQQFLKPIKLWIRDDATFSEFYKAAQKQIGSDEIVILKRNFSIGNPVIKYSVEEHGDKKLIQLRFFNSINIYVEKQNNKSFKWIQQFENERFRCQILYNNPKKGEERDQVLYFDTRKTLGDLKNKLSQIIGIPIDEFRIKKSKNTVAELTTYKKKLGDMRFVSTQYLFLQQGKSSRGSIILRKGMAFLQQNQLTFELFDEVQIDIDAQTNTVKQLKQRLCQKFNLSLNHVRIRQYKACQFGQIFTDKDDLQRIKEKSLVWEQTTNQIERGYQVYIRLFDLMSFALGPLQELYIDSQSSYEQLTFIIQDKLGIQADRTLCWRSPNSYVDRSYLLDCQWNQIRFLLNPVREQPLFIRQDGALLIIKQSQTPYSAKPSKNLNKTVVGGKGTVKQPQLKITVVGESQITTEQAKQSLQIKKQQQKQPNTAQNPGKQQKQTVQQINKKQ